jgi:hypothetical protein
MGDPGSFVDLCENTLLPKGVLITPEVEALKKYGGNKHKLLFSWSMVALKVRECRVCLETNMI